MDEEPSLYDWAGGGDAFARLINAFYDLLEADRCSPRSFLVVSAWRIETMSPPGGRRCSEVQASTPNATVGTRRCWRSGRSAGSSAQMGMGSAA